MGAGNPYHHHQDLNRLAEAWTRPETIIVQDPMFTATAQRADIVLPATTSIERDDLAGNKRSDFILAMRKAIEPLGESRSESDIFNVIAGQLGVAGRFNEGRDKMGWLRHLYEASRSDASAHEALSRYQICDLARLLTIFSKGRVALDIDHGNGVVVLVGNVENLAGRVLHEQLGIRPGGRRPAGSRCRLSGLCCRRQPRTSTNLSSRVISMPRGRWPTLMVLVTVQLPVSITEMVFAFSLET